MISQEKQQSSTASTLSTSPLRSEETLKPSFAESLSTSTSGFSKSDLTDTKLSTSDLKLDLTLPLNEEQGSQDVLQGLDLPDSLDSSDLWDTISPVDTAPEETFTSQVVFSSSDRSSTSSPALESPRTSETDRIKKDRTMTKSSSLDLGKLSNVNNEKQKDSNEINNSNNSLLQKREEQVRRHSRDFEVANKSAEKKKWSVTIDPFTPTADIVNRKKTSNDQVGKNVGKIL